MELCNIVTNMSVACKSDVKGGPNTLFTLVELLFITFVCSEGFGD